MQNVKESQEEIKPANCARCNTLNSPDSKFCNKCGLPIDSATITQMDKARAKIDELLNKITEDPKKLQKLLALLGG